MQSHDTVCNKNIFKTVNYENQYVIIRPWVTLPSSPPFSYRNASRPGSSDCVGVVVPWNRVAKVCSVVAGTREEPQEIVLGIGRIAFLHGSGARSMAGRRGVRVCRLRCRSRIRLAGRPRRWPLPRPRSMRSAGRQGSFRFLLPGSWSVASCDKARRSR